MFPNPPTLSNIFLHSSFQLFLTNALSDKFMINLLQCNFSIFSSTYRLVVLLAQAVLIVLQIHLPLNHAKNALTILSVWEGLPCTLLKDTGVLTETLKTSSNVLNLILACILTGMISDLIFS